MEIFQLPNRTYWRILMLVLLLAMAIRLIVILSIPTLPVSDFWSYFQRAISLADKGVYEALPGRPDASYTPGYSVLLSLFFKLPGDRLMIAKFINLFLSIINPGCHHQCRGSVPARYRRHTRRWLARHTIRRLSRWNAA